MRKYISLLVFVFVCVSVGWQLLWCDRGGDCCEMECVCMLKDMHKGHDVDHHKKRAEGIFHHHQQQSSMKKDPHTQTHATTRDEAS